MKIILVFWQWWINMALNLILCWKKAETRFKAFFFQHCTIYVGCFAGLFFWDTQDIASIKYICDFENGRDCTFYINTGLKYLHCFSLMENTHNYKDKMETFVFIEKMHMLACPFSKWDKLRYKKIKKKKNRWF